MIAALSTVQGTTGKELMKLTDDILAQIGIKNPLHRMQLINTRDDLIAQQQEDTAVKETDSPIMSKPSSPNPSFVVSQQSPKVSSNDLLVWPQWKVHSSVVCCSHCKQLAT